MNISTYALLIYFLLLYHSASLAMQHTQDQTEKSLIAIIEHAKQEVIHIINRLTLLAQDKNNLITLIKKASYEDHLEFPTHREAIPFNTKDLTDSHEDALWKLNSLLQENSSLIFYIVKNAQSICAYPYLVKRKKT